MNTILSFLILLILPVAQAEIYESVDIDPLVAHFNKQVVTLHKSFTTYNWAPRQPGDFWSVERPQNDPELLYMAKNLGGSFWRSYGAKEGAGNMFGYGLYTAVDPVTTVSYGQSLWRVAQIEFPAGLRILDFANADTVDGSDATLAAAAQEIEEKFDCPRSVKAEAYFLNGGAQLSEKCRGLMLRVFNDILKINAFAYGYSETGFKECGSNYLGTRAFVITRTDWMRSEHIHFYTADSRLNEEERIRIQTLFLKSESDKQLANQAPYREIIAKFLDTHPEHELQGSKTVCEGDSCVITISFCDQNFCEAVPLPALPRPGGPMITEEEAKRSNLLWPDLVGKPKSATVSTWLKDNKFGCSGELPYKVGVPVK